VAVAAAIHPMTLVILPIIAVTAAMLIVAVVTAVVTVRVVVEVAAVAVVGEEISEVSW